MTDLAVRARRVRMVRQGGWALADQMLSSGTNFLAAIVVARLLGPAEYGSYALAFAAWVVVMALTRSMLVQPYIVSGAELEGSQWRDHTRLALGCVLMAGVLAGVVLVAIGAAVGFDSTGRALATLGVFLAGVLVQDFWRYAAFTSRRPELAFFNDGIWAGVLIVVLFVLWRTDSLTAATAVAAWSGGAVAGAVWGVRQFQLLPVLDRRCLSWARKLARLAGWFGAANVVGQAGTQAALLIIAGTAGRAAVGG
ncbi:MAG: hypothetical protein H0V19_06900, partial [Euzebyales bacterium]|nr:hypothetical protein [Euzebyales bacterium]